MSELYKGELFLSSIALARISKLTWNSAHQLFAQVLKKYEEEDGRYLICGTNAYKPECRDYVEVIFPQSKIFCIIRWVVISFRTVTLTSWQRKARESAFVLTGFPLTTTSLLESEAAKQQLHLKKQNVTLILTRCSARTTTAQQFSSGINCTRAPPLIIRFVFNNDFDDQVVILVIVFKTGWCSCCF